MRTIEEIERQFLNAHSEWNQSVLQELIDNKVEERFDLDYKAAPLLDPNNKDEITKVVSAMANSAGGVVMFGVAEHREKSLRHLPERIDPIQRSKFGRERLDQILSQIQPVINGLRIHPVTINSSSEDVVYVVVIPQSATAHQATDLKYYYRSNDRSEPMRDYQIRDVMNRLQHPKIAMDIEILEYTHESEYSEDTFTRFSLNIRATNNGSRLAKYVTCFVWIPTALDPATSGDSKYIHKHFMHGGYYHVFTVSNLRRRAIDSSRKVSVPFYEPLLPGISTSLRKIRVDSKLKEMDLGDMAVHWEAYADNAPVEQGTLRLNTWVTME